MARTNTDPLGPSAMPATRLRSILILSKGNAFVKTITEVATQGFAFMKSN